MASKIRLACTAIGNAVEVWSFKIWHCGGKQIPEWLPNVNSNRKVWFEGDQLVWCST